MPARYGGEEFAIILLGVEEAAAVGVVQALLDTTPLGQTFSAGVAVCGKDEALAAFVARADELLYAAKAAGRARILGAPVTAASMLQVGPWGVASKVTRGVRLAIVVATRSASHASCSPQAATLHTRGMQIVLFLLVAWVVLSVLGLVIKGLFWLFVIGLVLFIATAVWGFFQRSR